MSKRYYDIEEGREVTREELEELFNEQLTTGDTECTTFDEYLHTAIYYACCLEPIED